MNSRRLFAGVKVEATGALREALAELQRELKGERIRWVRLENLHLTVEFFGKTEEEEIPALAGALAKAAGEAKAFAMRLGGLGAFGGAGHPRVLWMGVESEGLFRLHERVKAELREMGWSPEAREFAPHLTLGRIDRLKDADRFNGVVESRRDGAAQEQAAQELILFESAGGRYVPIGRWPLKSDS